MKKKFWIWIILAAVLAALVIPVPTGTYEDGGTREYTALTYKIVDWNRMTADSIYDVTKVYFFPYNFRSIDALWYQEEENVVSKVIATVVELTDSYALVQPVEGQEELLSADLIHIDTERLGNIGVEEGGVVEVSYTGGIMETYPARINAVKWEIASDLRHMVCTSMWLDKETAQKQDNNIFSHIIITEAYADCFFAQTVIPMPYQIKLNGTLDEKWCVGDQVLVTYENTYYDAENQRVEADVLSVEASDWAPEPGMCYKPVIYLYPEAEIGVSVRLDLNGKLTCTYPSYNGGWTVTAAPDGTLTDVNGQTYNYLYWEGEVDTCWDMSEGFCVKGKDTAAFLEESLAKLGLTRREANEFIVYWLPLMQGNPYNIISFQTDAYTDAAALDVEPAPDTLIRVFMTWRAADAYEQMLCQELTAPERRGFTVVEWGGAEVK